MNVWTVTTLTHIVLASVSSTPQLCCASCSVAVLCVAVLCCDVVERAVWCCAVLLRCECPAALSCLVSCADARVHFATRALPYVHQRMTCRIH